MEPSEQLEPNTCENNKDDGEESTGEEQLFIKQDDIVTSQTACVSCPVLSDRVLPGSRDTDVTHSSSFLPELEHLQNENERLKRKEKYMDNLGVLVTDFKQENQILNEENLRLRRRLEELELAESREESEEKRGRAPVDPDLNGWNEDVVFDAQANHAEVPDSPFEVVEGNPLPTSDRSSDDIKSQGGTPYISVTSTAGPSDVTQAQTAPDTNPVTSEAAMTQRLTSLLLDGANATPTKENRSSDVTTSMSRDLEKSDENERDTATSTDELENLPLPLQIRQLEEMVGLHDTGNDVSVSEASMTSQFSKLAAVFARLAQKVTQSQKKARNSQAFCDALMKENEKTKTHLNEMREQNEALKRENEELKRDTQCQTQMQTNARTGSSSSPPSGSSDVISRLQARVKKLEGQRTEILRVNRQWDAQYRRLKQEFDTRSAQHEHDETSRTQVKFQAETPSTSASASAGATKQRYEEKRKRDIDVMLMSAKKEIRNLMQEKAAIARNFANAHSQSQTLKRELSQLKEVNRKLETDKSCMEAENQRLNLALEAAYSIHHQRSSLPSDAVLLSNGESNRRNALLDGARYNMLSSSPEEGSPNASGGERSPPPHTAADAGAMDDLRTQIEVLQEQVKIYREDFETERRDREKSQGDKQRLDDQLTRAKHEVQALTQQVRTHEYDFQQERRDKERLKRQLQMLQNRDHGQTGAPPSSRNRDRYHGDANLFVASRTPHDPPAYYAHSRFTGNDETANPYQHRTSNSRRRTRQPAPARQDWRDDNLDIERLLSYPPDVAHDQPNAL
uniref:TNFAIP3-interacting protein 1 n=1 Tax=Phallusia mammillata TaxID=59560 RepID=A0A6F9DUN9_9ASCI|nr:TNFAIP3-interacting protein 1 [Phallusia mammillata]